MTSAGRPTSKIRLGDLDPLEVAADVVTKVLQHVSRVGLGLAPSVAFDHHGPSREEMANSTDLGRTVQRLCLFAQRGELGDWPDASYGLDAARNVCETLFSQAGVPGPFGLGDAEEAAASTGPDDAIGLVLVGAIARGLLALHRSVTPRQLATLAGVSREHATRLAPELGGRRPRYSIKAPTAQRWLRQNHVIGI